MPTTTPRPGIDLARLLIGDGHVSTSPRAGYVFSCQTRFGGGGAQASGSWVHSDGTYDFTAKPTVDGAVTWPSSFMIQAQGARRVFTSNDLPNHPTGQFPIAPSDDAYQFDRNPNSIRSQNLSLDVPTNPVAASQPSCLPMGAIGIMITGSVLFNALDAGGRDAVAHEIQDGCQGHPEMQGEYHYHSLTTCVNDPSGKHSTLLGYALDGFGIYGRYGEDGKALTDADLDDCHGHTHAVEWDGKAVSIYHYHAASEYPYTLGCFKGTPATIRSR
ncbi:MAG: YHYH protein [Chloroflexi bacterium]|nr:YHYH protein [Chloroflexota bacterium]